MDDDFISLSDKVPDDNQDCIVLFDDKTESTGKYWASIGIFALTGPMSPGAKTVTHWKPNK